MAYVAAAYLAVAIVFAVYAWTLVARQRDLGRRARYLHTGERGAVASPEGRGE